MKRVIIVTEGLSTRNLRGFLLPLIQNKKILASMGLKLEFHSQKSLKKLSELRGCYVGIENYCLRDLYQSNFNDLKDILSLIRKNSRKLILFDVNDDTGTGFFKLLPYVDEYRKAYVYKDKRLYMKNHYGGRIWSHYYHKKYGITDKQQYKNVLVDEKLLRDKIKVGYLLGLYNHLTWFIGKHKFILSSINKLGGLKFISKKKILEQIVSPTAERANLVSCRINTNFHRATIGYHRELVKKKLKNDFPTAKISRMEYLKELKCSKIVISPFGWGEINLPRDYEVAMMGAILMKPDISHLETYPDIFNKETIVSFDWDCDSINQVIDDVRKNYSTYQAKAIKLQDTLIKYLAMEDGIYEFCKHFAGFFSEVR